MTVKDVAKLFKRFFITFLCCVPVFLGIGFLLDGKIQPWIMTFIFVVIGGGAFALEEFLHNRRVQKREKQKESLKGTPIVFDVEKPKKEKTNKTQKQKNKNNSKQQDKTTKQNKQQQTSKKQQNDTDVTTTDKK